MMNSGIIITISICALLVMVTLLFYCICWKRRNGSPIFYMLNETSGLQRISGMSEVAQSSISVRFLRSSGSTESKNEDIFTSKNLQYYKTKKGSTSNLDLLDSMEVSHSFENSTLEIDNASSNATEEEVRSCRSSDSMCTYYTTNPALGRTSSRRTFVSIQSDMETLID